MPVSDGADTFLTGERQILASQGYEPMEVASPVTKELEGAEPVDGVELGKKILALETQVAEPVERSYRQIGGPNDGAQVPENRTVSAEQAAHDVARARESDLNALEGWEAKQVQDAIDALRADQQPAQEQVSQLEAQPNPQRAAEQQPAAQTDDDVVKILQNNPRLLSAVNEQVGQHYAQAQQVAQQYAQATAANAQSAYQNLLASFPEVANVRPDQLGVALQVLAQSQPQRAQQIAGHVQRVTALAAEAQKAQQAEAEKQAQYRQLRWNYDAQQADDQFSEWAAANLSGGQHAEITQECYAMLEEYGLGRDQIAREWNSNPLFRSFPAQRLMADAARFRLAQKQIQSKQQRVVPTVQRPGSPLARGSEQEWNDRNLNERINRSTGRDQIRAAAELIAQRRARNGR